MSDNECSEQDLNALRSGDLEVLARCFQREEPRLRSVLRFRLDPMLSRRIDLDDLLQEVYVAAAKRIQAFADGGFQSVFLWLRLIALQTLVDQQRHHLGAEKRDVGKERSIKQGNTTAVTSWCFAQHLVATATSPSALMQREDLIEKVHTAIAGLEDKDQEILALRHFVELRNAEIAELLDITAKTASIRYVRALQRLQESLKDVAGFTALGGAS